MSDEASKRIRRQIRSWRLHLRSGSSIGDLARAINPIVRGWTNYYGRFYRSELVYVLDGINHYLMRWATRKFKRLRRHRPPGLGTVGHGGQPATTRTCSPTGDSTSAHDWVMGAV
ncbi:group II intron maturase-specific domain-containing protein [Dactylosporangium sp. NPDC005555]|uniref:group II intron maturase-specific domain-containing protein n=1 Tax=Dactylosporangium sp. NPDC005555 TaxID=3154889 RepID=UPI0033AB48A9